jgi:hypothetical protein
MKLVKTSAQTKILNQNPFSLGEEEWNGNGLADFCFTF